MLHAALLPDFKWADTVLVWGDHDGIATLVGGLAGLRDGTRSEFVVGKEGGLRQLRIFASDAEGAASVVRLSTADGESLDWTCSRSVIGQVAALAETLLNCDHGHQYVDVSGLLVSQVMISTGEYPAALAEA